MIDFPHFWPRYGFAVAVLHAGETVTSVSTMPDERISQLVASAIAYELGHVMLYTRNDSKRDEILSFEHLSRDRLHPGKVIGGVKQEAANGYYLAPHVASSNNAADIVAIANQFTAELRNPKAKLSAPTDLLRSYAPLVSKINNGRSSMTNPRVSLFAAACTLLATLTSKKPAAYVDGSNHVLVPDLPLTDPDTGREPLLDFIRLFDDLRSKNIQVGRYSVRRREEKETLRSGKEKITYHYRRPPVFQGNYPGAPWDATLGPLGVIAAIGIWAQEIESFMGDSPIEFAERILVYLTSNPLYVVSYAYEGQRKLLHLGNHLVHVAMEARYELPRVIGAIGRTKLYNGDRQGERLYRTMAARFIQSFESSAFRDFLTFRSEYDPALTLLLEEYIMTRTMADLSPERRKEIVSSAREFGAGLNYAAYIAAVEEMEDDKKKKRQPRPITEYKARKLIVLESTAFSARTHEALLGQLMIRAGRETGGRDLWPTAGLFMEAVAAREISLDEAKQLAIAFMRLRPANLKVAKTDGAKEVEDEDHDTVDEPTPADTTPTT